MTDPGQGVGDRLERVETQMAQLLSLLHGRADALLAGESGGAGRPDESGAEPRSEGDISGAERHEEGGAEPRADVRGGQTRPPLATRGAEHPSEGGAEPRAGQVRVHPAGVAGWRWTLAIDGTEIHHPPGGASDGSGPVR